MPAIGLQQKRNADPKRDSVRLPEVRARSAIEEFFELSPDAMIIVDRSRDLVAANPAADHLFGYPPDKLIGRNLAALLAEEPLLSLPLSRKPEPQHADYSSPVYRHATARFQLEGKTKAGTRFPLSLTSIPLTGSMATLTLVVLRDTSFNSSTESATALTAARAATDGMAAFQRDLLVEVARGHGLGGIAAAVHRRTGRKVLILDSAGGILASAGYGAVAIVPRSRIVAGHQGSSHAVRERYGDCWTVAACPDRTLLGRISVFDPAGDLPEVDLLALEQAVSILAAELLRLQGVADDAASRFGEFAAALLDGRRVDEITSQARMLDYDVGQTHQVVAIQAPEMDPDLSRERIEAVEQVAQKLGVRKPLVTTRSHRIILILPKELPWERLAAALSTVIGVGARISVGARIGVGGEYPLEDVKRSLAEAIFALELGTVVQSDKPVTTFGDLGVWRILVDSNEPTKLREFVSEWIGPLIAYDERHGSELVKSLTTYLKESCATEAAAAALFIHRNTLRYRLSKVSQITGRDLGDADQRFQLELACRAWVVLLALDAT